MPDFFRRRQNWPPGRTVLHIYREAGDYVLVSIVFFQSSSFCFNLIWRKVISSLLTSGFEGGSTKQVKTSLSMEDISSVLNLMIINASDTLPGCRVRYFNPISLGLKGLEGHEISSTCTKKVVMSQHEISQLLVAFKSVWIPLKRMWCRWIWSCLLYGCHAGTFLLSQRSILLAFLREGAPFLYGENRPTTYELSWVARLEKPHHFSSIFTGPWDPWGG